MLLYKKSVIIFDGNISDYVVYDSFYDHHHHYYYYFVTIENFLVWGLSSALPVECSFPN